MKTENEAVLDFDWTRCEPNSPLHPETLVQSLDDTPERFQSTQTKNIQLRNELRGYLLRGSDRHPEAFHDALQGVNTDSSNTEQVLAPPEWSIDNISAQFQPEEMAYITVYDIGLLQRRGEDGQYTPTRQHSKQGIFLTGWSSMECQLINLEDFLRVHRTLFHSTLTIMIPEFHTA